MGRPTALPLLLMVAAARPEEAADGWGPMSLLQGDSFLSKMSFGTVDSQIRSESAHISDS